VSNRTETPYVSPRVPEGVVHEVSIGRNEGFGQLIAGLRDSELDRSTPVGALLLDKDLTPTELSSRLGAFDSRTGKSMVMFEGDKIIVDAKENVWFIRDGEDPRLIIENKDHGPDIHALTDVEMRSDAPAPIPSREELIESTDETIASTPVVSVATPRLYLDEPSEYDTSTLETSVPNEPADTLEGVIPSTSDVRTIEDSIRELNGVADSAETSPVQALSADDSQDVRTIEDSIAEAGVPPESFTNQHGIEVTPTVAVTYEWKVPGTDKAFTVAYGGSAEEQGSVARAYASAHPGSTVYFMVPERDSLTGQVGYRMDAWDTTSDPSGQRVQGVSLDLGTGVQGPSVIGVEDLTRKLANPYIYEAR